MTDDPLSFVDNQQPEPVNPPEPAKVEPAAAPPEPAAVVANPAEPPKAPVPPVAPQAQVQPQSQPDHTVPLAKYLDSYNEARELKRENQRLKQEIQAKNAPPVQAPDPLQDPEGFRQHMMEEAKRAWEPEVRNSRLLMSEQIARQQFGDEAVTAAMDALEKSNDPLAFQKIMNSPHPGGEVVNWHRQHKLLNDIGTDPDAYVRRRYAELTAADPANPAAPGLSNPKPALQIPPPSLGRAPAGPSAATVPVGPGQAFDALFSG